MLQTNSKTFTLDQPYQDGDKTIDELILTKPTVYQLSGINLFKLTQFESDEWIKFLPRICPELATNLDKLDPADYFDLMVECSSFFLKSPKGSQKTSMK